MKQKKVPMRRCIGCYESKPKKELLRIVKKTDGGIVLDFTGKQNGRGAYVCNNPECLDKIVKGNKLNKEFEIEVLKETYDSLKKQFAENCGSCGEADSSKSGGGAVGK